MATLKGKKNNPPPGGETAGLAREELSDALAQARARKKTAPESPAAKRPKLARQGPPSPLDEARPEGHDTDIEALLLAAEGAVEQEADDEKAAVADANRRAAQAAGLPVAPAPAGPESVPAPAPAKKVKSPSKDGAELESPPVTLTARELREQREAQKPSPFAMTPERLMMAALAAVIVSCLSIVFAAFR